MTPFLKGYVAAWIAFCLIAAVVATKTVRLHLRDVVAFLRVPWKVALFTPAVLFTTFAGRYTDDETWDVISGGGMSVLAVGTAWWAVGALARVVRRKERPLVALVALAVTLFSSSWFYDGYLLLRDGAYTPRWIGNLMLSPIAYLSAGIVANLEVRGGAVALAFTRDDWPRPLAASKPSWTLALATLPLVALAAWVLVGAVGWRSPF